MHTLDLDALNRDFELADPKSILRWSVETFRERLAIVTSFQPSGMVTLHMLEQLGARPDVLTVDTGLLFPETYALMDAVTRRFDLRLKRITPRIEPPAPNTEPPWSVDPDACCHHRKVLPLQEALTPYSAWVAGLRRDQKGRAETPMLTVKHGRIKIHPFANWTESMLWTYLHAHELPYNALHDYGYPSIGCWPCTRAVRQGEDARDGRWADSNKNECGIHF